MKAYRFSTNYGVHTKMLANDDEAFKYASEFEDSAVQTLVEKFIDGDWFEWDRIEQKWVYNTKGPLYEGGRI
jgi:hypothetical protein